MRVHHRLGIGVVGLMLLASAAMAQDRNQDPRQRAELLERQQAEFIAWIKPRIDAVLRRASENVAERYGLTAAAAGDLQQALGRAADAAVSDGEEMWTIGTAARMGNNSTVLVAVLSKPAGRAALAEHLSEQQVQDYLAYAQGRADCDAKAIAAQLTAWADQHLSLTPDQRAPVGKALMAGAGEEWLTSQVLLRVDPNEFVNFLRRLSLDPRALHGALSASQARIWKLLAPQTNERQGNVPKPEQGIDAPDEPDPRLVRYREAEAAINQAVEDGRITREQANARLGALRQQLWADETNEPRRSSGPEPEGRTRQLAEAKLAAHTGQLGELDARAARRLALASKGVVELYVEAQTDGGKSHQRIHANGDREARFEQGQIEIQQAVAEGRITREQAAQRLGEMRLAMARDEDVTRPRSTARGITDHPLYQQTIKDVLSKEAYAGYQARQAERLAFWEQASRRVVVASLDTLLLLSEQQRTESEEIAAKLPVDTDASPGFLWAQLVDKIDRDGLSDWQRRALE
jgi:hypothetical protein